MSKQYGLILPEKKTNLQALKPAAFQSDSDSDGASNIPTAAQQNVIRPKDISAQQKAMEEDPTVYQYDEIYDKIENKKAESKLARKDVDKKPKYINKLLQSANRRKRENELRIERQVQKDRVAEGDEFKDKEEFVTSSYRKKLEELRELEEQEKREEYLETIGDVTKQSDLGGFYRHLYEQQVKNEDKTEEDKPKEVKSKDVSDEDVPESSKVVTKKENKNSRKYRKRDNSESQDSEAETPKKAKIHLPSNLDADSDFSIESSDSDAEEKTVTKMEEPVVEKVIKEEPKEVEIKDKPLEFEPEEVKEEIKPVPVKIKIDIWKKRTVGAVFDEAVKRYYERKSARLNSG